MIKHKRFDNLRRYLLYALAELEYYINMTNAKISDGIAHQLPDDLKTVLQADKSLLERWEDLTPLARNEWICWTVTCKRSETRAEHIRRVRTELLAGKRRPCCWAGCPHRTDKAMNATQKWLLEKQNK